VWSKFGALVALNASLGYVKSLAASDTLPKGRSFVSPRRFWSAARCLVEGRLVFVSRTRGGLLLHLCC